MLNLWGLWQCYGIYEDCGSLTAGLTGSHLALSYDEKTLDVDTPLPGSVCVSFSWAFII